MRRSLRLIALAQFIFIAALGQKKPLKDSLLSLIRQNQLTDTSRVRTLNELGKTYRFTFPDSTIYFSKQAHELAAKISDVPGIATSLNYIGIGFFYTGNYPEAQKYQKEALAFAELHSLRAQKANAHNSLALAYQYQGNYVSALENYLSALKIEEDAKNYLGIVKVLANTAILFKKQGDIDNAIAYNNKALELTSKLKDARVTRANISNNLGSAYIEKKAYLKALEYLEISLKLNIELNNKIFISTCYGNMGYCYFKLKDIKKAEEYGYRSLKLARETGATEVTINTLLNLVDMKITTGDIDQALTYELEAFELAKKTNSRSQIIQCYRNFAEIYKLKGDFKKGYDFVEKAFLLNDSLKNSDINKRVNDLQNSYELHKKEGELKLMEKDARIKSIEMKEQRALTNNLAIIVGALVICVSVVFYGFRMKSRVNQQLKRQNEIIESVNNDLRNQALRAQMNPHFIFNALNSIQCLIMEEQTKRSIDYLSKFASLLRQVMDNSEKSWIPLEDEINLLKLYLDLEALRFDGAFSYDVKNNGASGLKIPPLLVQPYAENAIRHGLLPKVGDKKLEIAFSSNDRQLLCEVRDNGIGREAALAQSRRRPFSSKGMNYTAGRIQMLNTSGGQSNVSIEDLMNDGKPAGTLIKIAIDL